MDILYIFPHPDDESFGPAAAMWSQRRRGHRIHLLTLTKGGATKVRHSLGYSVEEMGNVRYQEMMDVANELQLESMTVLDLPDSGLAELDPRVIEQVVSEHIKKIRPDILVSYPVHGISGFPDHLVTHAVVKRVYCALKEDGHDVPRRLAMFTVSKEQQKDFEQSSIPLKFTPDHQIHVRTVLEDEDRAAMDRALECYRTYQDTIDKTIRTAPPFREIVFQLFDEQPTHVLPCITTLT